MSFTSKIFDALNAKVRAVQAAACQPIPSDLDVAYESGRRIGVYQGLRMALSEITQVISDDAKDDNDL